MASAGDASAQAAIPMSNPYPVSIFRKVVFFVKRRLLLTLISWDCCLQKLLFLCAEIMV